MRRASPALRSSAARAPACPDILALPSRIMAAETGLFGGGHAVGGGRDRPRVVPEHQFYHLAHAADLGLDEARDAATHMTFRALDGLMRCVQVRIDLRLHGVAAAAELRRLHPGESFHAAEREARCNQAKDQRQQEGAARPEGDYLARQ